jgi:hypothetical protein
MTAVANNPQVGRTYGGTKGEGLPEPVFTGSKAVEETEKRN